MNLPQNMMPDWSHLWKDLKGADTVQHYIESQVNLFRNYNPAHFMQGVTGNNTANDFKRYFDGFSAVEAKLGTFLQSATTLKLTPAQKTFLENMLKRMKSEKDFWAPGKTAELMVTEMAAIKRKQALDALKPVLETASKEGAKLRPIFGTLAALMDSIHDTLGKPGSATTLYQPAVDRGRHALDQLLVVMESADKARLAVARLVQESKGQLGAADWSAEEHYIVGELRDAGVQYKAAEQRLQACSDALARYMQTERDLHTKLVNPAPTLDGLIAALGSPLGQLKNRAATVGEALRPIVRFNEAWTVPLVQKTNEYLASVQDFEIRVERVSTVLSQMAANLRTAHSEGWGVLLEGKAPYVDEAEKLIRHAAEHFAELRKSYEPVAKQAQQWKAELPKSAPTS